MSGSATQPLRILPEHESNRTSQCGEDGIVETIFRVLHIRQGVAVEFGAWDGVYLSNTARLRENGWRVCLIEGDSERFDALRRRFLAEPNAVCVNCWVTPRDRSSLDSVLQGAGIGEVDFLSIDIDGDEYHILQNLNSCPKVICVEFNPTIPPPISLVGRIGEGQGSSLVALEALASTKGYALIYATLWNAFFVRNDLADRFVPISPCQAYCAESARVLISEYNGRNRLVDFTGRDHRPWNPWSQEPSAILLNLKAQGATARGASGFRPSPCKGCSAQASARMDQFKDGPIHGAG